nr:serine/threonine protein kinase [Marseillevirus futianmevirus]
MCSVIKVQLEGKIHIFRGKDDIDAQIKLDAWVDYKVQSSRPKERTHEFIKISRLYGEGENTEVRFYRHLEGTELTPRMLGSEVFLSFQTTYEETGLVLEETFSYLSVERYENVSRRNLRFFPHLHGLFAKDAERQDPL